MESAKESMGEKRLTEDEWKKLSKGYKEKVLPKMRKMNERKLSAVRRLGRQSWLAHGGVFLVGLRWLGAYFSTMRHQSGFYNSLFLVVTSERLLSNPFNDPMFFL